MSLLSRSWRSHRLLSSAALLALLVPVDAWPQSATPAPHGLDPIVVTTPPAQRAKRKPALAGAARSLRPEPRTESAAAAPAASASPTLNLGTPATSASRLGLTPLQTPASIDIVRAETIAERGQRDVLDAVTQNTTGMTATPEPGNGGVVFSTRGFSGTSSVMTLLDGTRLYVGAGTVTFPLDTWSTGRIEVLRGPASVMYGEGAIGGAINVVSKQPLDVQRNQAELSLDTNLTRRIAVDSGGPINQDVAYRITATGNMSEGWVDRDKTSNVAMSAAVRVKQTDDLTWTLSTAYGDRHPSLYYGTPLVNGRLDESLRFKNYNVGDSTIRYQDSWTQLKSEWQATDGITIRNALYYLNSRRHWKSAENYAFNPASGLVDRSTYLEIFHDQQQIGDRMDATFRGHLFGMENSFVAGFDVNRISFSHSNNSPYSGSSSVDPFNFDPGLFASPDRTRLGYSTVTNQYAVFAENRLQLTEQLALIGGIRQDQPTVERTDLVNPANSYERSYSATTWRGGAVFTPIKDLAFYAQYATAVDPVGGLITASNANSKFELATGKQVEIGVKHSFWGGRGEWTLAAYQIVKNNLLARDVNNPTLVVQVGQQSSRGIEASLGLALDHGWRIDANTAWLQAKYDDFVQAGGVNYAGNVPVDVPLNVSNVWVTWAFATNWSANAGVQLVGKRFADSANTLEMPGYALVNAGLQWKPDSRQTLALRLTNLLDEVYATSSYVDNQWLLGRPRTAELSYNVKF